MGFFDNLLGGGVNAEILTKKDIATTYETSNVNTTTESTSINYSPQTSSEYNVIINSAGAGITSKKEQISNPSQSIEPTVTPTTSQTAEKTSGGDSLIGGSSGTMLIVGVVAVGGLIAYSYLGKKKK